MKFVTIQEDKRIGVQVNDRIVELKSCYISYLRKIEGLSHGEAKSRANEAISDDMTKFIEIGEKGTQLASKIVDFVFREEQDEDVIRSIKDVKIGPPVPHPPKDIICLARNYPAYVEKGGIEIPEFPLLFMKARSSILGPEEYISPT